MLRFSQNKKPQTNFHILQNNIVSTIASTWGKKMHGYSFSRAKLEEKWEIRGTDYAQGNSYEDIFSAKWRLLCLLSFKHFLTHVKKCLRIAYRLLLEMFTFQCSLVRFYELTDMCFPCSLALAGEVFGNVAFRPIAREQKYLMDHKKKLWEGKEMRKSSN